MKIVEIVPRPRAHLYDALIAKQAAIHKNGRGTYSRVGPKARNTARWKHKMLAHGKTEVVTAKVRGSSSEDERRLLSSFLGFVDRHGGEKVDTITIQYR